MTVTGLVARSTKRATDIAKALADRAKDGVTEVIVREEQVPTDFDSRLAAIEEKCLAFATFGQAFDALSNRIKALEERPQVVAPKNDAVAVPAAFGELVAKVTDIAERITDVESATAALAKKPEPEVLAQLNEDIADLSATALSMFQRILNETEELRRRANKSDTDLLNTKTELRDNIFRDLREAAYEERMSQSA